MSYSLGLDIGTTSTIGTLIDSDGDRQLTATRAVELYSDHAGWAEEDPRQWWSNAVEIIRELIARAAVPAKHIRAVGVTGMLPAVVLLDREDHLIRRSIQQSDGRTACEVEELRAEVDAEAFLARTGNGINQQLVASKLRWLARHEPDSFRRIATVFGSYDYVNWRLTGAKRLELNWALESGFYDLKTGRIAPDLVALGGIEPQKLPEVSAPHFVIGEVTREAAAETGLREGTPLVAGSADHVASAFAAGVVAEGDVLLKFGGAGDILLATASPRPDSRLFLDFHIVPGLYLPNGCMACSGAVLNWVARELATGAATAAAAEGSTTHRWLDRALEGAPRGPGEIVMLPYFLGEKTPIHDPSARGTLVGIGLHHTIADIWRAALEAVAFGFRHHIEVFNDLGYRVGRLIASDGGAASQVWMRIAADVLGRPVDLLDGHPGSSLGAAFVAGRAVGAYRSWTEIARFVRLRETIEPDPAAIGRYDQAYGMYRAIYERLKPLYPELARLSSRSA
jgi:xylulokinase